MEKSGKFLQDRVSRRKLIKKTGLAIGAAGMASAVGPLASNAAPGKVPTFLRQRFAGEELTVLYMQAGTYDEAARLLAPEFEKATGAKVKVVAFPYQNLHDNAATDLVTQTGAYDVIDVAYQWDGEFAPYLTPLDDLVAKDKIDMSLFIPNIAKLAGLWDGKRNGIPNANDAMCILYRTDLYKTAGLEPPKTWQEYNDHAKALTKGGVFGASWVGIGEQLQSSWISRYWEQGKPLCDENWRPLFNSAEGVKAVELLRDALPYTPPGMPGWDIPTHKNAVLTGQVAQAELWPSFVRADARDPSKSKIVGEWALTPFPGPSELSIWDLAIPATTKKQDLAWEWIKAYTSADNAKRFADQFGIGSPQLATWTDPDLLSKNPEYPQIFKAIESGKPIWRIPQFPQAWDVLQKELEQTVYQNADPKQTLDKIADEWNKLLDSNPPTAPYVES
jgi:ABC-type glycerol-3-phosphate transport system substrate-binding protein